jgi:hypothetical protein
MTDLEEANRFKLAGLSTERKLAILRKLQPDLSIIPGQWMPPNTDDLFATYHLENRMTIETGDGKITPVFDADTEERLIELAWTMLVSETGINRFILYMNKRYLLNPDNEEWELVEEHRFPSSLLSARPQLRDTTNRTKKPRVGFLAVVGDIVAMLGISTVLAVVWALITNKNGQSVDGRNNLRGDHV